MNKHSGALAAAQSYSGMDKLSIQITRGNIRTVAVGGEVYGSVVDVIAIFRPENKNPRQYWKDHKAQILAKDPDENGVVKPDDELVANLYQLKLTAGDGKERLTDVAPLWVLFYIAITVNQEFRKQVAKFTAAEIKYRMGNVSRGCEWAADSIHEAMKTLSPPDDETPREAMGYSRNKSSAE